MGLLYSKMKMFHFKEQLDALPKDKEQIVAPIHVRIKPTNVCNHKCRYCAYTADSNQLGQDMVIRDFIPKDKIMEIIDDLAAMGVKAVTFSGGGEPFCYPFLTDVIKKLSQTKIKFACLTNGSRLKGELAELFAHHGTWLRVSVDGWDDKSYSVYRGVPEGEFTQVMRNMTEFKKLGGKCVLGVNLVVDKDNAGHVYELIRQFHDINVDSVKISPCIISNSGLENNKYHQPFFEKVKDQIRRAIKEFSSDTFEIFDSYHEQLETFKKKYTWCPYLQILPVIAADQNVYSCHDKAYNLKCGLLGSIKNIRFKDFWLSDKDKYFKINPKMHCNHHCVANARNELLLEYFNADQEHLGFV